MSRPYFYIIKHIPSGKLYAGSRWAVGCYPEELLKPDGYLTSSTSVHKLIEKDGLNSFEIVGSEEMDDPYEYETKFLQDNDCANSIKWINLHNNDREIPPFGTDKFKSMMVERYGVEHNTHIPEVREQMTKKQKEFYKNNPEFLKERAKKARETAIKNGTDGKGFSRPHYTNNGNNGKYIRDDEWRSANSERQKKHSLFALNNPMNDPEKRKLVSLSKIGRKKFINPETSEIRMVLPENAPEGYILYTEYKKQ